MARAPPGKESPWLRAGQHVPGRGGTSARTSRSLPRLEWVKGALSPGGTALRLPGATSWVAPKQWSLRPRPGRAGGSRWCTRGRRVRPGDPVSRRPELQGSVTFSADASPSPSLPAPQPSARPRPPAQRGPEPGGGEGAGEGRGAGGGPGGGAGAPPGCSVSLPKSPEKFLSLRALAFERRGGGPRAASSRPAPAPSPRPTGSQPRGALRAATWTPSPRGGLGPHLGSRPRGHRPRAPRARPRFHPHHLPPGPRSVPSRSAPGPPARGVRARRARRVPKKQRGPATRGFTGARSSGLCAPGLGLGERRAGRRLASPPPPPRPVL